MTQHILIVEDEPDLAFLLRRNLEAEGFTITHAADGELAIQTISRTAFDLIILDLMLPKRGGLDVLQETRRVRPELPVIVLTARSGVQDRVRGLKLGADDYVTKPFDMTELIARVQAVLRRTQEETPAPSIRLGDLEIDFSRMQATRRGVDAGLSSREFQVLRALAERRGEVVRRDELLRAAWGPDEAVTERTIDAHIKNLRKKIELDPKNPVYLRTVQREGYLLVREA